jgi:HK97 family phage prohead protease
MLQRSFKLTDLTLSENNEYGYFEGYASVFNIEDLVGDIIQKGAFTKTLSEWNASGRKIPLLYQHDPRQPIGVIKEIREDDIGLYVEGEINLLTEKGKEAYALLKQGALNGLSIGFEAVKTNYKNGKRVITEVKLWEISLVTFPANTQAKVISVKKVVPYQDLPLADMDTLWDAGEARKRIAKWASSDGSGDKEKIDWGKYRKAFLWYNEDAPDNFGSYKMPIADVIDGRLKAVPRAIFAAAAVLMGARGGVDIPAEDKELVKRHLEKYYAKMGRIPPWQEEEKAWEFDLYTLAGISEWIFEHKEGKILSRANATLIAETVRNLIKLLDSAGYKEMVQELLADLVPEPVQTTQEKEVSEPAEVDITQLIERIKKL